MSEKIYSESIALRGNLQNYGELADILLKFGETDTPTCPNCGTLMQRSGSCHTCPECGQTSGCA